MYIYHIYNLYKAKFLKHLVKILLQTSYISNT